MVLATGLSACSDPGEQEPDPLDTIEGDPQSDPGPEPAEDEPDGEPRPGDYEHPEPGPEIDDDGQAGAEAAAVYFVELFSYIHNSGDFEAWNELTVGECNFCVTVREEIAELHAGGGFEVMPPPEVMQVNSRVWEADRGDYLADLLIETSGSETFDGDGNRTAVYAAESVRVRVLVEHERAWRVIDVNVEDLEQ